MIFVTVGTDHHPFDRLIQAVDALAEKGGAGEEVFVQTGSSTVSPRFCASQPFLPFDDLMARIEQASMIICHGGPGSIMPAVYLKKVPVVWPREKKYREVVDDHQLDFSARLADKGLILRVTSADELKTAVLDYDRLVSSLIPVSEGMEGKTPRARVTAFSQELENLCQRLITWRENGHDAK
ncbi:MAG: multidrug MFS transporter [Candidatus Aminicenantes bacterium]|nr:multidrug MFS transporter [Candidatus Aminicenantes bacterium]